MVLFKKYRLIILANYIICNNQYLFLLGDVESYENWVSKTL